MNYPSKTDSFSRIVAIWMCPCSNWRVAIVACCLTVTSGTLAQSSVQLADQASVVIEELRADPTSRIAPIPIGPPVETSYTEILGPFRHRPQIPTDQRSDLTIEYGIEQGGLVIGLTPPTVGDKGEVTLHLGARLENRSSKSVYFLTPDGTEHPFEFVLVSPQRESFYLTEPIRERMKSWRRLSGASIDAGKAAEFKFEFKLGVEVSVPGQYLVYALAPIPKGLKQDAIDLYSENMLFTLSPEQVTKIASDSGAVLARRRAAAPDGHLKAFTGAKTSSGSSHLQLQASPNAAPSLGAATLAAESKRATWSLWLVGSLLLLLAAIVYRGLKRRGKTP